MKKRIKHNYFAERINDINFNKTKNNIGLVNMYTNTKKVDSIYVNELVK